MFSKTIYSAAALVFAMAIAQGAPIKTLRNHVPRAVNQSRFAGHVAEFANLKLAIGLPLRNPEDLDLLVEQIADPQSANYRQHLTASEFSERFAPTQQDYDKLIAFVEANGFTVSGTHANRMILDVTGPVRAVNRTFHISLTVWDHPSRGRFFAPDREPSLETDVQMLDVSGLDNFVAPRPMDLKLSPLASAAPQTSGSGPAGLFLGKDFRAAYAPGVAMTGAGQTIGLIEFDGFYAADVVANFKQAGLPAMPVSTVLLDGFNGSPGSSNIEVILDIMMAAYIAPGANIVVYEGYYPNDILNRMATDNIAKQISCSWGYGINATTEQIFKQMIAQGQSFFTASGDSGAYSGVIMTPADNPNVTSVGGTALTTTGAGGSWVSESAWNGSGGGISTAYPIPTYQQNMNMSSHGGSNSMRNIPDVALTGAVQMYLIYNNGQQTAVGGTSAATPLWAAFTALVNQQAAANGKPVVGFLNPAIYAIGNAPSTYAAALHDITTGSNGYGAIPGFDLSTGWGSPNGQSLINNLSSIPTTPSFTLSATPNTTNVQAGSNGVSTIQVVPVNGFSAAVTLSLSGLPSGVTGSFSAFSNGASTLTFAASTAAVPGTYALSVKGVSGTLSSSAALNLIVTAAPSFSITTSTPAVTVVQSASATAPIAIVPANGFTGTVALTFTGLPSGVTASVNSSTLTFVASASAAAATSTITITGKSGTLTATLNIALTVVPPASFSIAMSTPALNIVQGATATSIITVTPKNGFTGKVALTISGLPSGVTASMNSDTNVATFTATSTATVGTTSVTVTGTYGTTTTSAAIALTVKAGPSFTLAAAPASLSVMQGGSGSSTLTVTPLNGFTGTTTFAIAVLPAGVTAAFTGNTVKLTAASSAALGASTLTITGTSAALSAQTSLALTMVAPPSFKLTSSASNVNVVAGSSAATIVTIAPQAGFTGTIALTATGLPAGITASFNPASTATSSTLTLSATSTTAAKVSTLTINGVSGSLSASLSISVTVIPAPDFSIAYAPSALRVLQGGKGSSAISLAPLNGFSGSVMLSTSGLPTGVTASFSSANSGILELFTVSSTAIPGTSQVNLIATSGGLSHTAVLSLTIAAPTAGTVAVDLSPFYNVPASAVDGLPFTTGGLDAGGRSFSGMLLGASQTLGGVSFSIGPMGLADAVSGLTVTLPAGQYASLKILATGVNGNQPSQKFTITYSDGTTSAITQSLSDWFTPQNYTGETSAMKMAYRDNSPGTTEGAVFNLYGYSLSLNSAKAVRSITLPQNRNVVVLAMTLVSSTSVVATSHVDLSKAVNGVGITSDGKTFTGGLDGVGYAYSAALLANLQLGTADQPNVVSGSSAPIALPAGQYSSLTLTAAAVNGAQLSQPFKVTYSDGTSTTFTQSLSDWFIPNNYSGELTALAMPYRNTASGVKDNRPFALHHVLALNGSKAVSSITLPANSNVKVFAMDLKP